MIHKILQKVLYHLTAFKVVIFDGELSDALGYSLIAKLNIIFWFLF